MQYPWWIPLLLTYFTTGQAQSNSESLSPTPSPSDDPQLATLVDVVQLPVIVNGTEVSNTTASAAASVGSSEAATTTEESASSASQESAAPTTYSTTAEETPSSSTASSSTPSSIPSEVVDTPPAVDAPPDLPPPSPSAELPPTPEFLSFNEWREKYVVLPDPSTRRAAKRAGQLARQDTQGGGAGAGGGAFDGDGADLGSLFSSEEGQEVVGVRDSARFGAGDSAEGRDGASVAAREGFGRSAQAHELETVDPHAGKPPSNSSPIQPLPNVGTGDPSDPLPHLKDRSNYAAFECAAMVHRSSRQSKGASSILVEKKDRYMLTPCSAEPKFVEVELCDEIQIDNIVLANFELFSSMFKHFEMTCSVDYPGRPDTWHNLGQFRARNARGIQVRRLLLCALDSPLRPCYFSTGLPPSSDPQLLPLRPHQLPLALRFRILLPRLAPPRLRLHAARCIPRVGAQG